MGSVRLAPDTGLLARPHEVPLTHTRSPLMTRAFVAVSLATLMVLGSFAPAFANAGTATASASNPSPTIRTSIATSAAGTSSTSSTSTANTSTASTSTAVAAVGHQAQTAVQTALGQVGTPYVWGGNTTSGFDCSGLTSYAWQQAGVTIPRTSAAQSNGLDSVTRSQLQPGDLVFFHSPVSHVAMYVGDGQVVEAPFSGSHVRVADLAGRNPVGYGRP